MRLFGLVLLVSTFACAQGQSAPAPSLEERLEQQRVSILLGDGRISGPGADKLSEAANDAQFVMIGEDHGIAEIARFASAYFSELAPRGFTTLFTENGPETGKKLNAMLHQPDQIFALQQFLKQYPFTTAFYNWREEAEFLRNVAQAAGPKFHLYGFDQELMGSAKHLLDLMSKEKTNPRAAAKIKSMIALEADSMQAALASGRPDQLYMMAAKQEDLDELRKLLNTPADKRALALLDALEESRGIYNEFMKGSGFESNARRSRLMKRTVAAVMANDPSQKALLKAGASHVYRGINYLGGNDLGSYMAEYCESRGTKSLHVMVMAMKGTQLKFAGVGKPEQVVPIEELNEKSLLAGLKPIYEVAAKHSGEWSVFDLRTIRRSARTLAAKDPGLQHIMYGFDFVVVIPEGDASHPL